MSQSYSENKKFCKLIEDVLNKKESSLASVIQWYCGGGSACYDLGFVITQVVYRIGEADFLEMCKSLESNKKAQLEYLILAGLEYGYDAPRFFKEEFPNLEKELVLL